MTVEDKEVKADEKKSSEEKVIQEGDSKSAEKSEKQDDDTIRWRAKYKVAKEELETTKAKAESEKLDLSTKVENTTKERQMYEQKYVEAEVKAAAVAAGIKDIEFVKLINTAEVKLDDKGNVTGVEKAITDLKARKPDWFGSEKKTSTSTNASFAETETKKTLDARNMSKEDWNKNKSRFMAGQF